MKSVLRAVVVAALLVLLEAAFLRWAVHREVAAGLLASGGTLPIADIAIGVAAISFRLTARLAGPALVVQAVVFAAFRPQKPAKG